MIATTRSFRIKDTFAIRAVKNSFYEKIFLLILIELFPENVKKENRIAIMIFKYLLLIISVF